MLNMWPGPYSGRYSEPQDTDSVQKTVNAQRAKGAKSFNDKKKKEKMAKKSRNNNRHK